MFVYPESYDVIVVGGGGTGLMSALAAARHGRSVLLLEKGERLGGTTGLSVGTVCATSTRLQRQAGIQDHPDSHFADLDKFVGPLLDRDNLDRLITSHLEMGVRHFHFDMPLTPEEQDQVSEIASSTLPQYRRS